MKDVQNQAKTRVMPSVRPIDSLWNLAEDLRVTDAAALIAGYDPVAVREYRSTVGFKSPRSFPKYEASFRVLCDAVENGRLNADLKFQECKLTTKDQRVLAIQRAVEKMQGLHAEHVTDTPRIPDWSTTTITRDELVRWLISRGVKTGFFFDKVIHRFNFFDSDHKRYPPRLAAAVRAWLAVTDVAGTSPKQALKKWLQQHAADYGLINDDGNLNEKGIEEIAKVANWDTKGGAPSTPGK